MDLFEAHKKGLPLVVETADGGARLVAEIFPLNADASRVVFADAGWPSATLNPFHELAGPVREDEDGWRADDVRIRVAFEGEPLFEHWKGWLRYREAEGKVFDRERCWREIQQLIR